jgi:hypothetical protein
VQEAFSYIWNVSTPGVKRLPSYNMDANESVQTTNKILDMYEKLYRYFNLVSCQESDDGIQQFSLEKQRQFVLIRNQMLRLAKRDQRRYIMKKRLDRLKNIER